MAPHYRHHPAPESLPGHRGKRRRGSSWIGPPKRPELLATVADYRSGLTWNEWSYPGPTITARAPIDARSPHVWLYLGISDRPRDYRSVRGFVDQTLFTNGTDGKGMADPQLKMLPSY